MKLDFVFKYVEYIREKNWYVTPLVIIIPVALLLMGWVVGHSPYKQLNEDYEAIYLTLQELQHDNDELKAEYENLTNKYRIMANELNASIPEPKPTTVDEPKSQQILLDELSYQRLQQEFYKLQQAIPLQVQQWKIGLQQYDAYEVSYKKRMSELHEYSDSLSEAFASSKTDEERNAIQAKLWDNTNQVKLERSNRQIEIEKQMSSCFQLSETYIKIADVANDIGMAIEERAMISGGDRVVAKSEAEGYYKLKKECQEQAQYYQEYGHLFKLGLDK
ncbi:hypothetical protein ACFLUO_02835 [Chloroflexota bacterium]